MVLWSLIILFCHMSSENRLKHALPVLELTLMASVIPVTNHLNCGNGTGAADAI